MGDNNVQHNSTPASTEEATSAAGNSAATVPELPTDTIALSDIALIEKEKANFKKTEEEEALATSLTKGTADFEKKVIKACEAKEKPLQDGDTWFLLSVLWWKRWKDYVSYDLLHTSRGSPRPGEIDNAVLLEPGTTDNMVRKSLLENYDYVILSKEEWFYLFEWYGGGPGLPRKVISSGWRDSLIVEVRPLHLKIVRSSDAYKEVKAIYSKADKVGKLKADMCTKLELNPENIRLWDYHARSKIKLLTNMDEKLDDAQIIDGQLILFEEKKKMELGLKYLILLILALHHLVLLL